MMTRCRFEAVHFSRPGLVGFEWVSWNDRSLRCFNWSAVTRDLGCGNMGVKGRILTASTWSHHWLTSTGLTTMTQRRKGYDGNYYGGQHLYTHTTTKRWVSHTVHTHTHTVPACEHALYACPTKQNINESLQIRQMYKPKTTMGWVFLTIWFIYFMERDFWFTHTHVPVPLFPQNQAWPEFQYPFYDHYSTLCQPVFRFYCSSLFMVTQPFEWIIVKSCKHTILLLPGLSPCEWWTGAVGFRLWPWYWFKLWQIISLCS